MVISVVGVVVRVRQVRGRWRRGLYQVTKKKEEDEYEEVIVVGSKKLLREGEEKKSQKGSEPAARSMSQ